MGFLLLIFLAATGLLIIRYAFNNAQERRKTHQHGCKPPKQYSHLDPIFGIDLFIKTLGSLKKNEFLLELTRRFETYGSTFQSIKLGRTTFNSIETENIQVVFGTKSKDWGVQPIRLDAMRPFAGKGVLDTDNAPWEHSRMLLSSSFKTSASDLANLDNYLRVVLDRIPGDGTSVDLTPLLASLFFDTATLSLFGESFDALGDSDKAKSFIGALELGLFGCGVRIALGPLMFLHRDPKWRAACEKTHQFADRYVDRILEQRSKVTTNEMTTENESRRSHNLIAAMAEHSTDREELRSQVIQGFLGSHETSAVLIANVFFLLARNPGIYKRLREEILSVASMLDMHVVNNLTYLHNVLNEALRFLPVFPWLTRIALNDTVLPVGGGPDGKASVFVPKGSLFETSFYVLHRNTDIWGPTAGVFNPDRWDSHKPGAWEYLPFSGGLRACPGRGKALTEASFVVARLVGEFESMVQVDHEEWTGKVQLVAKNAGGCKVGFVRK